MFWLHFIVIFFAIAAYNGRDRKPSPRYWATLDLDSIAHVAVARTDSATGVDDYLESMAKLKEGLK